jgi:hypothetical protein
MMELTVTTEDVTATIRLPAGWTEAASNDCTRVGLGPMDRSAASTFAANAVLTVQDRGTQSLTPSAVFTSSATIGEDLEVLTAISTSDGAGEPVVEFTATVDLADHSVGLAMTAAASEWPAWAPDFDAIASSLTVTSREA